MTTWVNRQPRPFFSSFKHTRSTAMNDDGRKSCQNLSGRVSERSHERDEQSWRSGLPQKRMMKQLEGGGSLSGVSY
jgi:hypothetical protein